MIFEDARDQEQSQRFTRRAMTLFGLQALVAGALGARLWQLQVLRGDELTTLAEQNRVSERPFAPPRGEILDRAGRPLAINRPNYRVEIVRERIEDLEETLGRLRRLGVLDADAVARLIPRLKKARGFAPTPVARDLEWEIFARVNANAPALPGVVTRADWARSYPEGDSLAHVIGYVAAVTEKELEDDRSADPLLRLPEAAIGKSGVERALEERLRGAAGRRRVEVNAVGREIRELDREDGVAGARVTLTIDRDLQAFAMRRLAGQSGAAVVMDVETGDLVALACAPSFDPNKFVFGISEADWAALRDDEKDPLRNKALAGAYPPGSTFKMLTALAALEAGTLGPRQSVTCTGAYPLGDRVFHCWKKGGHGAMRLRSALKESCDVYFYDAAKRAGIAEIVALCKRFGLGEAPAIEIPNVKAGNLPTPEWMQAIQGRGWSGGDTLNVAIGQGALLMTPLQLAVMTARIANGRYQVAPRLVQAIDGVEQPPPAFEPLGVSPEHMALVHEAMDAVSNEAGGTAYRSRIVAKGLEMAGKTGTAQVRIIGRAEREAGVRGNDELPWRLRDHALFVAYAPVEAPRYAIAVVIEHGGGGSTAAAPVARDVLLHALYGAEAPLEAYPEEQREAIAAARAAAVAPGPAAAPGAGVDPEEGAVRDDGADRGGGADPAPAAAGVATSG